MNKFVKKLFMANIRQLTRTKQISKATSAITLKLLNSVMFVTIASLFMTSTVKKHAER